jgi:hypothetical protein
MTVCISGLSRLQLHSGIFFGRLYRSLNKQKVEQNCGMLDTLPSNWFIVVRTGNGPFHLERTNGCTTGVDFCCLLPNRLNANSVTVNQNLHNSFTCVFLRNMTILVPQSIDVLWTHMGIRRNRHNQIQCHFCIRMQSFSTQNWIFPNSEITPSIIH